jgi:hypothetical protein
VAPPAPRLLRFRPEEPLEVVAEIASLRQSRNGWVNFRPFIEEVHGDPEDQTWTNEYERPKGSALGIGGLLLKPAPPLPECTWVPGEDHRRKGPLPDSIGLQHPAGARAGPLLVADGVTLPDRWRVVADNARRGLVLELPRDADVEEAVRWLLHAAAVLSPHDLPPDWVLEVHTR